MWIQEVFTKGQHLQEKQAETLALDTGIHPSELSAGAERFLRNQIERLIEGVRTGYEWA